MFLRLFVVGLCTLQRFGAKADMHSTLIDITLPILDPDYFDVPKTECTISTDSSGETGINCDITLIKTLPTDADLSLKIMGLSMGEYTLPTGIDLHMKLCEAAHETIIMAPFFFTLFPTRVCPPEPNIYVTKGYTVPMHLLPDSFDENIYKVSMDIKRGKKYILTTEVIVELEY